MNQTKTELSMARRLYREVLTDEEVDQAVEEVLARGNGYAAEFSVRLLAALIQDKVRERGGPIID